MGTQPRPDPNWVARLRTQPWFSAVSTQWGNDNIPAWVAEGVIANEDTSLQLGATGTDAPSVGLYQINLDAHPDVTRAEAADPVWSTQWFDRKVAPMLAADPELRDPSNIPLLVQKLERSGWPGSDSVLDAAQAPQRIADMQEVVRQNNVVAAQPAPTKTQAENPWSDFWKKVNGGVVGAPGTNNGQAMQQLESGWLAPLFSFVDDQVHRVALVLLGLVLLAVAIIWLAGHEVADALREGNTQTQPTAGGSSSEGSAAGQVAEAALLA